MVKGRGTKGRGMVKGMGMKGRGMVKGMGMKGRGMVKVGGHYRVVSLVTIRGWSWALVVVFACVVVD